jgi:hypothetical protein
MYFFSKSDTCHYFIGADVDVDTYRICHFKLLLFAYFEDL